ncbi:MAG: type II toxin-antitoxin system Phd/YefM family antitoxin, partial [Ilumatobacteraceae bacterium]
MTKSAVVGVHEAKTHLSRLLERVEQGEEIEISRRGQVVARLVAAGERRRPLLGASRGLFEVPDDFDAPMDVEWLDLFY